MSNVEKNGVVDESLQNLELSQMPSILSSPSLSLLSKRKLITNLDVTIAQFSDGNLSMNSRKSGDSIIEDSMLKRFAPPGLEGQFKQLYSIIFPSLYHAPNSITTVVTDDHMASSLLDPISSSSAAILMGARGSGKSLLLESVLAACQEKHKQQQKQCNSGGVLYRKVTINGIVCRGQDVSSVVNEIIRQLSEIAFESMTTITSNNNVDGDDDDAGERRNKEITQQRRHRKRQKMDRYLLRSRRSAFTSNLALLEFTLQIADADGIPILLVLDELDSFTEEGERQMLLYHFLDRVATPGSNLILVGITSSFSALTLLEKRIRSRAEGTAKIIYLRTPPTYQGLIQVMEYKLKDCLVGKGIIQRLSHHRPKYGIENNKEKGKNGGIEDRETIKASSMKKETAIKSLKEVNSVSNHDNARTNRKDVDDTLEEAIKLSVAMEREFRLGKDTRWFSRVIAASLSLYRHDCLMAMPHNEMIEGLMLNFHTKYISNAMVMMGASVFENIAASRQPDLCIVDGMAVSPRLQALLDLSTPQVALLLSARRILKREEHRDQIVTAPLIMERMLKEYESFRRGSTSSIGNLKLLKRAAYHLMEQGLLVPSMDHSGGGPMQYCVAKIYRNLDNYRILRLPLQIPLDIDRELGKALELNLLECPTALKEWGKSIK